MSASPDSSLAKEDREDYEDGYDEEEEEEEGDGQKQLANPDEVGDGSKTIIVGDWSAIATITDALAIATPGDSIYCNGGEYDEQLDLVDKNGLDISGPPDMSCIVKKGVKSNGDDCKLTNLAIQGCVEIRSGNLQLMECDISNAKNALQVYKLANPSVQMCTIHNTERCHLYIYPGGKGEYNKNQFVGNGNAGTVGVYMEDADAATVQGNTISNVENGVYTCTGCKGCQILHNTMSQIKGTGIYVDLQSKPFVRNNVVEDAAHYGVLISGGSGGVFSNNDLRCSLRIKKGCQPSLFNNTITSPPGSLINDDSRYSVRGVITKEPEKPKKKRVAA
eukprot:TRINITY_DN65642_c7_g5_i1.p1 TRINITY_DN65642_c7_g5~~TRINITY_DN65642_c7_g5_i1.p1  ORF type:complete len:334 (+),score=37.95 TRINITY_DN65642_c7_g5_i1:33-1034(+)